MGDRGDNIYILKSGVVNLIYHSIETGEEVKETIQKGEFFGVKSALAKRPREETVLVIKDTEALVLTTEEFEKLITSNITIITNFLRVFSNQLRKVGKLVHSFLNHAEVGDNQAELFKIGEYYLKNHKYRQAQYVYSTYLKHYKNGAFASQAQERLNAIEDALEGKGAGTYASMIREEKNERPMVVGDTAERLGAERRGAAAERQGAATAPKKGPAQAVPAGKRGEPESRPAPEDDSGIDIATKYYDAVSLYSQEKYEEAYRLFKALHASGASSKSAREYLPKIEFEMGRCLMALKKYKEAVATLTAMIKNYPKDENLKDALFNIGLVYKLQGDTEKATSFFNKVLTMLPESPVDRKAKRELASLRS